MTNQVISTQELLKKWAPILEHKSMPAIQDGQRKADVAMLLENQAREGGLRANLMNENAGNNMAAGTSNAGTNAGYDPVLISIIRRAAPQMIAYDVMGVQAMPQPTGLIFAMRARYGKDGGVSYGDEALFNSIKSGFSGAGLDTGNNQPLTYTASPAGVAENPTPYATGTGMTTAAAEVLGNAGTPFAEMSFSFDRVTVTANTRKLKASYSVELAQDLKALHGLDAEGELSTILSREITSEVNREVLGSIYKDAVIGATTTTVPGLFDLDVDSSGRWSVEKFKGLMFQIEREANAIYMDTRLGKGNIVICSADVASALSMAGLLDYNSAMSGKEQLNTDVAAHGTYAGVLNGRYKVYIDPYLSTAGDKHVVVVGYKGGNRFDAGKFYCPYVQLQALRGGIDPATMQPVIGYQTRYGLQDNPFAKNGAGKNVYYRKFLVGNLLTS